MITRFMWITRRRRSFLDQYLEKNPRRPPSVAHPKETAPGEEED